MDGSYQLDRFTVPGTCNITIGVPGDCHTAQRTGGSQ
jgi:hypothetical protein